MSVQAWRERLYPDPVLRDPVARFRRALDRHVRPDAHVLDVGAGAGAESPYDLKGRVARLVGIDLDPRVGRNPLLDAGLPASVDQLPFRDGTFDLAFSIYVLEHIARPERLAAEIHRVLKPGGHFVALTPSRFHYVSLIASCTPTRFHRWLNAKRGRAPEDTFPTQYKLNSRGQLQRHFGAAGFDLAGFEAFEVQPNYLTFSTPTYLLGAAYERIVNAFDSLAALRVNFIGTLRKRPC